MVSQLLSSPDCLRIDYEGNLAPAAPTSDTGSWVHGREAVEFIKRMLHETGCFDVQEDYAEDLQDDFGESDDGSEGKYAMPEGFVDFFLPDKVLDEIRAGAASHGYQLTEGDIKTIFDWGMGEAQTQQTDYWEQHPPLPVLDRMAELIKQNPDMTIEEQVCVALGMVSVASGLELKASKYLQGELVGMANEIARRARVTRMYQAAQSEARRRFKRD